MSLPNAYSLKTASIPLYFTAILDADIPDTFDVAFMTRIGFRYAIDRSFIDILKELHFLSDNGMPTKRYIDFHQREEASTALLGGIHEAYSPLFDALPQADTRSDHEIIEALKQLYAGKKSDMMISGIANTFLALCRYAKEGDFSPAPADSVHHTGEQATVGDDGPSVAASLRTESPEDAASPLVLVLESEADRVAAPADGADPGQAPAAVTDREPSVPVEAVPLVLELETEPASPVAARPLDALAPEAADARPVTGAPAPSPNILEPEERDALTRPQTPREDETRAAPGDSGPENEQVVCHYGGSEPESLTFNIERPTGADHGEAAPANEAAAPGETAGGPLRHSIGSGAVKPQRCPIQIVLPESSDEAVYDAIFASLRRHLFTQGE